MNVFQKMFGKIIGMNQRHLKSRTRNYKIKTVEGRWSDVFKVIFSFQDFMHYLYLVEIHFVSLLIFTIKCKSLKLISKNDRNLVSLSRTNTNPL